MCHLHQAFRPGVVDLPEDQIRASKNAITFTDAPNDFNFMDWSWAAAPPELASRGLHTAPETQINLRPTTREFGAYNFGRPMVPSIYGRSSTSRHGSHDETSSHLDSQDFSGIDLGLTGEGDFEMEDVREVRSALSRDGSLGLGKRGASLDLQGAGGDFGDAGGMDMGFDGVDLGLDLAEQPELPALEGRSRRDSESVGACTNRLTCSICSVHAATSLAPSTCCRSVATNGCTNATGRRRTKSQTTSHVTGR